MMQNGRITHPWRRRKVTGVASSRGAQAQDVSGGVGVQLVAGQVLAVAQVAAAAQVSRAAGKRMGRVSYE